MSINRLFKKMDEVEKAKILLGPNSKDVVKVNNIKYMFIKNLTMSIDAQNTSILEVDMKFNLIGDGIIPQLDPNKQYIIAEVE